MDVDLRPMTWEDIPLGMRLKELAGWNQTPADWDMLLSAGTGLVAVIDEIAAGTATVVGYGGTFSWVGMILVDPALRRRGVGTALLEAAIELGRQHGVVRLDATPQGEPLYRRLGFEMEYGLIRMQRPGGPLPVKAVPDLSADDCRLLPPDAIQEVSAYDAPIFGAPRSTILQALRQRAPQYAHCLARASGLAGYCLGRQGSGADQIGPLIAGEMGIAQALLLSALRNAGERDILLDVPTGCPEWVDFLHALGFVTQRPFTRMRLGSALESGPIEQQFLIAGPEIG